MSRWIDQPEHQTLIKTIVGGLFAALFGGWKWLRVYLEKRAEARILARQIVAPGNDRTLRETVDDVAREVAVARSQQERDERNIRELRQEMHAGFKDLRVESFAREQRQEQRMDSLFDEFRKLLSPLLRKDN